MKKTVFLMFVCLWGSAIMAQPTLTVGNVSSCCNSAGVTVDIPVLASNYTGIGGFSLYITYPAGLSFNTIVNAHPSLTSSGFFVFNGMSVPTNQVGASWFSDGMVTLSITSDTLFVMRFTYTCVASQVSNLNFNLSLPTRSESFDLPGDLMGNVSYINGSLTKLTLGSVGSITGPANVCAGQTGVGYSITAVSNASNYTWTVPTGATIISGQGTNAIVIDYGNTSISGSVGVTASDPCGNTTTNSKAITVSPLPAGTGTITGPVSVCQGTGGHVFSVSGITNASTYNWVLPAGASITSGSGTSSITVAFSPVAVSGNITVQGQNGCGLQYTSNPSFALTVLEMPIANAGPDQIIIINTSTTLSGSATAGTGNYSYLWSPSAMLQGGIANIQNPNTINLSESQVYTLTVTDVTTGCVSAPDQVQINITGLPLSITSITATPPAICLGQTSQLSVVAANGSGIYTYTWAPAGSLQGSNTIANPVANPTTTTTFTVTVFDGEETLIETVTLTVYPLPNATAGSNTPICANATLNLTSGGGVGYAWSGPAGFTSSSQNPSIPNAPVTAGGSYTVTVTSAQGCQKTASTNVVVNALPTPLAGSNAPFCADNNLFLTASGGTSYVWTGPEGFTSNSQNPIINNAQAINSGTYFVTVTNANSCQASTNVNVTIYPLPVPTAVNNGPLCTGATLNLQSGGGVSYSWSGPNGFNSSTQNPVITPVPFAGGGTYSVTVTDVNLCQAAAITEVTVYALPTPTANNTGPVCVGDPLTLSAGGGTGYLWSGPSGFSSTDQNPVIPSVTSANAGTYNVTVTDANSCSAATTTQVTVHALPVPVAGSNSPVCTGVLLQLNASGGTSYQWSGPDGFSSNQQNPQIPSPTTANSGTYTVTVTNANGCSDQTDISVTVYELPVPQASSNSPVCDGGLLDLAADGGNVYVWTGPNGFNSSLQNPFIDPVGLSGAGTYHVTVTDGNSCSAATSIVVVINPLPTPTAGSNSPVCAGNQLNLNVNSFTSYEWSGPDGFTSILQNPVIAGAGLNAGGVYTVTVTDLNGCKNTSITTVVIHALPTPTANSNSPVCAGSTLSFNATGGTGYSWTGPNGFNSLLQNPGILNPTIAASGTYTVTVTDANNCSNTTTTDVVVNPLPIPSASSNTPVCVGNTLNLNANGGTGYTWTGPNTFTSGIQAPDITNVTLAAAGVYLVTVTDDNNCSAATSTTVVINALPVPTISSNAPICAGATLTLNAGGGTSYIWSGPNNFGSTLQNPSIPNATPAASGLYTVTVTNAQGCQKSIGINVNVHPLPVANAGPDQTINNGTATVLSGSATGGSGNYSYNWTPTNLLVNPNIFNPQTINLSSTQVFTLIVIDQSTTCQSLPDQVTITIEGGPLGVNVVATQTAICYGFGTTITANASGGSNTYTYTWASEPEGFTSDQSGISVSPEVSTTYHVSVFDGFTTVTGSITITVYELPLATAGSPDPVICANTLLELQGSASGGSGADYVYAWSGPNAFSSTDQNPTISNASTGNSGVYSLTVTDGNNCASVNTATINMTVHPRPAAGVSATPATTCANNTVNLSGTQTGGTAPYTYAWTGPDGFTSTAQNPVLSNAQPVNSGNYTLTVTDANGCSSTNDPGVTVTVHPRPIATADAVDDEICANLPIELLGSGSGGTGTTYTYAWSGPNSYTASTQNPVIPNAQVINSGTYSLTITDINGCASVNTATIEVEVHARPTASAASTPSALCQNNSFQLNATGSGGDSPYTWAWSGPDGFTSNLQSPTINNAQAINAGTYSVTVTDAEGCSSTNTATVQITIWPRPTATAAVTLNPLCANQTINLTGSGTGGSGTTYTYAWSGPNNYASSQQNPSISNAQPNFSGTYSLTITDVNACSSTNTATVQVTVNPRPTAIASVVQAQLCSNLTINLIGNASGGSSSNYNFNWSGPNSFSSNLQNPSIPNAALTNSGTYTLTVTDGNCNSVNTASVNVTVWPRPTAIATATPNSMCSNNPINLGGSGLGGLAPYTWSWTGPSGYTSTTQSPTIPNALPSMTGVYTLVVTDAHNCASTNNAVVNITVWGRPTAIASSPITSLCANGTIQLIGIGTSGLSPYTYAWSGPNTFSATTANPTISNAQPINSGTYTLTVTDAHSCSSTNTASVNITVWERPTAIASALQTELCSTTAINLIGNASGGNNSSYQFAWSGPALFSSPNQNPVISNAQTTNSGTYTLTVTDANNCNSTNTASVNITVHPLPLANAGPDQSTFNGNFVTLSGSATVGSGQYSYSWSPPGMLLNSNIQNPTTVNLSSTTTFTLIVTDLTTTCVSLPDQVTITITGGALAVSVSSDPDTICFGETTHVLASASGGSGNYTYSWVSVPPGFTSTEMNPAVTPALTTTYLVTISDGVNTASGSTEVHVNELPLGSAGTTTAIICNNLPINLTAGASGGSGSGYSYAWSGPSGFTSNAQNPVLANAQVINGGNYFLTVTDDNGCVSTNNSMVNVLVNPRPAASASAVQATLCTDQTLYLLGTATAGGGGPYTYQWSGPQTFASTDQNPVLPLVQTSNSGTYFLTVTDVNSCASATAGSISILVHPLPEVSFLTPYPDQCYSTPSFTLSGGNPGGGTYTGPFITNGIFNPEAAGIGTYTVTYHYIDGNTCEDSASAPVNVIFVPQISGVAQYDNPVNTLLGDIDLDLLDINSVLLSSTTTQAGTGAYSFKCLEDQIYTLEASTGRIPGGYNSTDALLAVQYGLGQIPLSALRQRAADVNANGGVNAGDALIIMRRFAGLIPTFPAGDWMFEIDTPDTVAGADETSTILCICTGDINGSNVPSGKKQASVNMVHQGNIWITDGKTIAVPVYAASSFEASAISLVITLPDPGFSITGIRTNLSGFEYGIHGNELRFAWYSLEPLVFRPGDQLFSLILETDQNAGVEAFSDVMLSIDAESEIADRTARPLPSVTLRTPVIQEYPISESRAFSLEANKPNPFSQTTMIAFEIPEAGDVRLELLNIFGSLQGMLLEAALPAGKHQVEVNAGHLPPGIYLYRLKYNGSEGMKQLSRRMTITR
ncbi:MAG TPA: dockerin type I domain-containing protein [Bacteroidales bacterium]|nr:dockerin type I domain-containing protein [Bacteroidales bacterium]HSA43637.1 dockerin type I domain-containing protein [Bacteroidales bacterium]